MAVASLPAPTRTPAPERRAGPLPASRASTTRALAAGRATALIDPTRVSTGQLLELQRQAGNRAVTALLQRKARRDISRTSKKGVARYSGERLLDRLREMKERRTLQVGGKELPVGDDELFVLESVAKVETGGGVNALNTWDDMIVSLGFKQVTLVHGSLYKVIEMAPEAFAKHGIVVGGGSWTVPTKYGPKKIPRIEGAATPDELRWEPWASRFYDAGMEDAVVAAVVHYTLGDIAKFEKKVDRASGGKQSPWMSDPTARAWLVETYNNRPAYGVEAAKATNAATVGQDLSRDAFLDILAAQIIGAYDRRNEGAKGRRIIAKISRAAGAAGAARATPAGGGAGGGAAKTAGVGAAGGTAIKGGAKSPVAGGGTAGVGGAKSSAAGGGAAGAGMPAAMLQLVTMAIGDAAVGMLAATGMRDPNQLTNVAFWARHPDLIGQKLHPGMPGFAALSREWLHLRDTVVRDELAGPKAAPAAAPEPGAKPEATATPGPAGKAAPAATSAGVAAPVALPGPLSQMVGAAKHPAVDAAAAKLSTLQTMFRAMKAGTNRGTKGKKNDIGEQTGQARDDLVKGIGELRAMVADFGAAGVPPAMAGPLAAGFYRAINAVSPFYYQHNNVIYEISTSRGESRDLFNTCNITSLSMCLEALGVNGAAYDAPAALEPAAGFFANELSNKAGDVTGSGLAGLRMPEVVALAATAENYGRNASASPDQVLAAAKASLSWITNAANLRTVGRRFGVAVRTGAPSFSSTLNTIGRQDLYSRKPKIGKVTRSDLLSDAGREKALAIEVYRRTILREIGPLLDAGKQVEVGQAHHFVRLQSVDDAGIVKDDPGGHTGADMKLTWNQARNIGLFWNYIVVG